MKVVISRVDLVSLIGKVQGVVSSKPTIPILSNLLLEAHNGQLVISSTDLTVSMRVFLEAKVHEEGAITLPARRFFQLIRELTSPQIEIHAEPTGTALITSGSSKFKIHGMDRTEYPTLPDFADAHEFEIANKKLKEMLSRSSFAAARDDNRQVLNGVYFKVQDGTAQMIGTDGKRLAKVESEVPALSGQVADYILPLKAVEELIRILDTKEDEEAKVMLMQDKVAVEYDGTILMTKLLSGQYPDVSRVIPESVENPIVLHREELVSLLRQVGLFTQDSSSSARFTFENNQLSISAMSGEIGEGSVNMPVNYSGEKMLIAFNPFYFLDILRHSNDETVNFSISDPFNPGLITDSSTAQFVIMPMRLEAEAMAAT